MEVEEPRKMGKPSEHLSCELDVRWVWEGEGDASNYIFVYHKSESEFHTVQVKYCQFYECLGSFLAMGCSRMKTITLF